MNNVYYGNNTTLQSSCNSGYFKVGEIKYTCNNGNWNKSGNCVKVCNGGPTSTVANSSIVSGSGNMYNSDGAVVSFNANGVDNYYYADGYTINGGCDSGYTKIEDVKYTCNDGSWSSSGSCIKKSGSITYNFIDDTVQSFKPSDHNLVNGDVITLEVWGAEGLSIETSDYGGKGSYGGRGGHSKGKYIIKDSNKTLYIVVGGQGRYDTVVQGGYEVNGYNNCKGTKTNYGGGGATHISTVSGTLDNENVWNNVIIVAGGGGAGSGIGEHSGGSGGGLNGGNGSGIFGGSGGTQMEGGKSNCWDDPSDKPSGKKGCGASKYNKKTAEFISGGGGYYGGGGNNYYNGSGGGSGYIGGVIDGTTENGKQSGNGMAKISW